MQYTVEIYRKDRRMRTGKRLIRKIDMVANTTEDIMNQLKVQYPLTTNEIVIHETFVQRRNLMTGDLVEERYDTPYGCSVASEAYWSN